MSDVLTLIYDFARPHTRAQIGQTNVELAKYHKDHHAPQYSRALDDALARGENIPPRVLKQYIPRREVHNIAV